MGQGLSWNSQPEIDMRASNGSPTGVPEVTFETGMHQPMKDCINMLLSLIFDFVIHPVVGLSEIICTLFQQRLGISHMCVYMCLNVICKTEAFIG